MKFHVAGWAVGLSLASIIHVIICGEDAPSEHLIRFRNGAPNANFGDDGLLVSAPSREANLPALIVNQPLHRVFNFRANIALREGSALSADRDLNNIVLHGNPAQLAGVLRRPRFRLAAAQSPTEPLPVDLNPALPGGNPAAPALPMLEPGPLIPPGLPQNQPPSAKLPALEPDEPLPSEPVPTNPSPTPVIVPPEGLSVNPTQRTALNQAFSTGESILDGIGHVPGSIHSPLLGHPGDQRLGFHLGPINYQPSVSLILNGIKETGEGQDRSGALLTLQAGISAVVGVVGSQLYGTLNYQTGLNILEMSGDRDRFDQDLSLTVDFSPKSLEKMQFALGVNFDGLSGLNRDIGTNAERDLVTIALTSTYAYSPKASLEWDLTVPIREFNSGISSSGATITNLLNYDYSLKTRIGVGVTVGTLRVEGARHQTFEQPIGRIDYRPSLLVSVNATVGYELRQTGGGNFATPVFGVGATWTPRLGTSISLAAERSTFNSADASNTNFTSTSVSLTLSQRLGPWITGSVSLGYENAQYKSVGGGGDGGRRDDLIEGQIGIKYSVTDRWSWMVSVSADRNQSNEKPIEDYQLTLQTTYQF